MSCNWECKDWFLICWTPNTSWIILRISCCSSPVRIYWYLYNIGLFWWLSMSLKSDFMMSVMWFFSSLKTTAYLKGWGGRPTRALGTSLIQLIAHKPPRLSLRERALGWGLIGQVRWLCKYTVWFLVTFREQRKGGGGHSFEGFWGCFSASGSLFLFLSFSVLGKDKNFNSLARYPLKVLELFWVLNCLVLKQTMWLSAPTFHRRGPSKSQPQS